MPRIDTHIGLQYAPVTAYDRYLERKGFLRGLEGCEAAVCHLDNIEFDRGILLHGDLPTRLKAIQRFPDRLAAFSPLHLGTATADWERASTEVKKAIDGGCIGIGSLYTYRENTPLDHPTIHKIAELACSLSVPVHIECAAPANLGNPLGAIVPPYSIEALVQAFPELTVILSSYGGGLFLYELMPELTPQFNNVYYDTASPADAWDHAKILEVASKIARSERLLFGSGAGPSASSLHPDVVSGATIPREVKAGILGRNISRLLLEKSSPSPV